MLLMHSCILESLKMSTIKLKLKHYIATHTFHSAKVRKEFRKVNINRKKNSDWFGNENIELKQSFFHSILDEAKSESLYLFEDLPKK